MITLLMYKEYREMIREEFDTVYHELTMEEKLLITKDTLRFLVDTNSKDLADNKYLKKAIGFVSDEIEYSLGLK